MVDMPPPQPKPKRLWRVVLVLSLALNLAVAGVILGAAVTGRIGDGPPRSFDLGQGPLIRAMLPRERIGVLRSLREDRALRDFQPHRRVEDMVSALQADPFDPDALRAVMAEQASRTSDLQRKAQDALMGVIVDMTPERRAEFADALEAEMAKPRREGPRPAPSGG